MKKFSLAITLNTLIWFITLTFIFLLILRFYLSLSLSILFSVLLSILFTIIYVKIIVQKDNKKKEKKLTENEIFSTLFELCFLSDKKITLLFFNALKKKGENVTLSKTGIKITNKKTYIFCFFSIEGLSKNNIIKAYTALEKGYNAIIYSYTYSQDVEKFAKTFNQKILLEEKEKIYALLKDTNLLPKKQHTFLTEKQKIKPSLKEFFDRKKAKKFLTFGLSLSIASLFVRYKIYYLISGIIFLVFFLISFCFGKKEIKN